MEMEKEKRLPAGPLSDGTAVGCVRAAKQQRVQSKVKAKERRERKPQRNTL